MCGIAGILSKRARFQAEEMARLARALAQAMAYRGPDDEGVWLSPDRRVALSHRRLSVIDTSQASHQPMLAANGSTGIAYNGELYNFRILRAELEALGHFFATSGDTEVLLAALHQWGTAALPKLDAMFAFAYYDAGQRRLLLGRDMFGEKPLYYADTADYLAFASELHTLTVLPGFDPTVERAAIAAYLSFQYVPAPLTIYRAASKLPPGHWLSVGDDNEAVIEPYFAFRTSGRLAAERPIGDLADELEELLVTSIERRMISDVPLGAFLSSGVDSSTIVAIATKRLGVPLKTFSIGFAGHPDSEHFDAAKIARALGTDHHERVLSADTIELGAYIGKVLDEPNGDTSCLPTYLLSRFAREQVTVALSGDGGDELFGGYGRYFNTVDEWTRKRAGDPALGWWKPGEVYLSSRILVFPDDELATLMGSVPDALAERLSRMRSAIENDGRPLLNILRELDAATYMPDAVLAKVDRMSMQHSLEVRAPLLGLDIAEFAKGLTADECYQKGQGKLVLKAVAERYLPPEWTRKPKRGFGLPMDMWGVGTLLPAVKRLLLGADCRLVEWTSPEALANYIGRLEADFHPYRAWALFVLEIWLRTHSAIPAPAPRMSLRRKVGWLSRMLEWRTFDGSPSRGA